MGAGRAIVGGTLAMALISTLADAFWAAAIPEHRASYGLAHGGLVLAALGAVLGWAVGARRRGLAAGGGLLIGVVAAALFYLLYGVVGPIAMVIAWMLLWVAFAILTDAVAAEPERGSQTLARGLAAAVLAGAGFWLISGIWLGPHDPGPLYWRNFLSWCVAFGPGFTALLVGRPTH